MTVRLGFQLGQYQLEGLIARGPSGEVHRARDTRLQRNAAIKLISPERPATKECFARFSSQAGAWARLDHPGIVTIYDVGSCEGVPFVATELLPGHPLSVRLQEGTVPAARAADYARQISDALEAAHRLGVIHGDLTPEHIFITDAGRVKIFDFGLANCHEEALELLQHDRSASPLPETTVRRISYLSPEQVRGEAVDARSDIFSLGVVLYELVSGRLPFAGVSAVGTLQAILNAAPRPLRSVDSVQFMALEQVIVRCLEKDKHARFQSAHDVSMQLEAIAGA